MNDKLAKILNKAREVKMTIEEKSLLKSNIMLHMESGAFSEEVIHELPKKSPYIFHSLFARGMVLAVVIIIIASGGVSFAANSSLPGEILYTVKVNINEKSWVVKDDEGIDSFSLLAPPVVIGLIKQLVKVFRL